MLKCTNYGYKTKVQNKEICVEKVGGKSNLADGLIKFVDGKDLAIDADGIGFENRTGQTH